MSYDHLARSILTGHGYQFDTSWYPFTPAHTPTAHWSFLYPLYLAAVYTIFGYHPLVARLLQAVVAGVLLPWFAYRLSRRFFSRSAGIAAAGLMAFYGYFIYHNAALMSETFYLVAILWAFDLAYGMVESGDDKRWWLLGLVLGAAVLLRQVYLFFIPVLLLWMAWAGRDSISWRRLVMVAGLVTLCIAPWSVRNYRHYQRFLLLNSNSGYAFYTANHPAHGERWDPNFVAPIPPDLAGANEAELDRELMSRGIAFVVADPLRYLKLTLSRIPYHFRFWPTPGSRPISVFVRMTSFGLYLPFMLVGLVLSRREWRRYIPLYLFAIIFIAVHVLSWPGPRYRFPVDAVMMIFAGLAVPRSWDWVIGKGPAGVAAPHPLNPGNPLLSAPQPTKLSIIIPVYNECHTIQEVVGQVLAVDLNGIRKEIVLVDDGSHDGSKRIMTTLAAGQADTIQLVLHGCNRGKGAAIRTGLAYVTGDLIIIQDADLEYDPGDFSSLLQPILRDEADVVYGSRFLGEHRDFHIMHKLGNRFLTWVTNMLYGTDLTDM